MLEMINYRGYLIMKVKFDKGHQIDEFRVLGEDVESYRVYESFALAYLDGENLPPNEFFLRGTDTLEEAHSYVDVTLRATKMAIESDRQKIYGADYACNR